jgi:hypothetical protein
MLLCGHHARSIPRRKLMAKLYCPCGQAEELWGEFWWVGGHYRWLFFDYDQTSETFGEQVENCPACGRLLERKNLTAPRSSQP